MNGRIESRLCWFRVVVWALLPALLAVWVSQSALACGSTLHYYIGHVAKKSLPPEYKELRQLINQNLEAYQSGLVFPDLLGHVIDVEKDDNERQLRAKAAAAYTHSPEFLTKYAAKIQRLCDDECAQEHINRCNKLKAHLLGVVGHIVADNNFDNQFVKATADHCYQGDNLRAQRLTDAVLDNAAFQAIVEEALPPDYVLRIVEDEGPLDKLRDIKDRRERRKELENRAKRVWNRIRPTDMKDAFVPAGFLESIIDDHMDLKLGRTTRNVLENGRERQFRKDLRAKAEPGTPRAKAALDKVHNQCPWAAESWFEAPGGVEDTATKLAGMMNQIWNIWETGIAPEFGHSGPWAWGAKNLCITNPLEKNMENRYCMDPRGPSNAPEGPELLGGPLASRCGVGSEDD